MLSTLRLPCVASELAASCSLRLIIHCPVQSLVAHCEAWQNKFTGLLNAIALKELQTLHEYFRSNGQNLKRVPTDLDKLAGLVQLHKRLTLEKASVEARFEPLHEKYRTLEKFEVSWKAIVLCQFTQTALCSMAWLYVLAG